MVKRSYNLTIRKSATVGTLIVEVRSVNGCGNSGWGVFYIEILPYGQNFSMNTSPNPASTELNIELSDSTATEAVDLPQNYQVRLYNPQNLTLLSQVGNQRNLKLNISTLEEGIYYLEIIYKEAVMRRRVVIRR